MDEDGEENGAVRLFGPSSLNLLASTEFFFFFVFILSMHVSVSPQRFLFVLGKFSLSFFSLGCRCLAASPQGLPDCGASRGKKKSREEAPVEGREREIRFPWNLRAFPFPVCTTAQS